MERKEAKIEEASLKDLAEIQAETKKFSIGLALIGGYASRTYTAERSWRFTKDMDFITTRQQLPALYDLFKRFGYRTRKTEFGIKGIKKINGYDMYDIKLDIAVDKVIDQSTGKVYPLPPDIFKKSVKMTIAASLENRNADLNVQMLVAPIEDVVIMKLMTAREKDHFDSLAMILDSFGKIDISRFSRICRESELKAHIRARLESLLADIKKGTTRKLWKEFTGRTLIREQEVDLKRKIESLRKQI